MESHMLVANGIIFNDLGWSLRHQFQRLSLSVLNDAIVALRRLPTTAELLISLGLLLLLTLAKTNKLADFIAQFIYKLASNFGLW